MRSTVFRKEIPLVAILFILTFSLASAADSGLKRTQGKVEMVDFTQGFFVVSESRYFWTQDTVFSDAKGTPVKISQLKPDTSVYIEWKSAKGTIKRMARKVCVLREIE